MSGTDPSAEERACRVVVDGDEDETFLVCLTCDAGREVCCGHHLAPHDENGCHEQVVSRRSAAPAKCQCARRPNARVAAVVTAPSPAAAGLPAEDVERVARAIEAAQFVRDAGDGHPSVRELTSRELAEIALAEMRPTAAVPDPRFRDQLAAALWTNDNPGAGSWTDVGGLTRERWQRRSDALMPVIAAEVEARLRAALAPVPPDADGGERR